MWEPSGDQLGRFLWGITVVSPEPEGCICSDHAADLGFVPSARHGHAPLAYDLTGSTSGQSARLAIQVLETQEPGVEGVKRLLHKPPSRRPHTHNVVGDVLPSHNM